MRQPQNARGSEQKISDEKRGHSKMQGAQNKRPPMKKIGNPKMQGAQNKRPPMKKRQPQNTRGSIERLLMKKDATPKCKGLKMKDLQ
jgi:hypothetical protein